MDNKVDLWENGMMEKRSWEEFRSTGLLLIVNQFLHIFGWAIAMGVDSSGVIRDAFPTRTKFRGFDEKSVTEAYTKVTRYLADNSGELLKEVESDNDKINR